MTQIHHFLDILRHFDTIKGRFSISQIRKLWINLLFRSFIRNFAAVIGM